MSDNAIRIIADIDLGEYADYVSKIVARKIPPEDVEDVTQGVMLDALEALPRFRGDSTVRLWLYRIARNDICTYYRLRKRKLKFVPLSLKDEYDTWNATNILMDLKHIIAALPYSNWRDVFILMSQGMGETEIARETGLRYNQVHGRYKKAMAYARGYVNDGGNRDA